MRARRKSVFIAILFAIVFAIVAEASAAPRKHSVVLGAMRKVPYSKAGDPSGAAAGEDMLKIRALLVDGVLKEWTTGDMHDVTDRSFVVRRVIRLNDALPTDNQPDKPAAISASNPPSSPVSNSASNSMPNSATKPASNPASNPVSNPAANSTQAASHWVWQRGPWLLIDRTTGHITALHLPDYDPGVSQVSWFRDYAAYCGVTATGKSLYAVVAQLAVRKPVLAKKLAAFDAENSSGPACALPDWQREPLRISFHPTGKDAVSYDFVPGSAMLVEDSGDEDETPAPAPAK
jgi:hypothetical protein